MALNLILNGRAECLESLGEGAMLSDAVAGMGLKSDRVAVEHNGEIVARKDWASLPLADGDKLEVVHFVGGGRG